MINRRLILRKRPETTAVTFDDCLEIVSEEILPDKLKKNEFVVKNLMLTIDQSCRDWFCVTSTVGYGDERGLYRPSCYIEQ